MTVLVVKSHFVYQTFHPVLPACQPDWYMLLLLVPLTWVMPVGGYTGSLPKVECLICPVSMAERKDWEGAEVMGWNMLSSMPPVGCSALNRLGTTAVLSALLIPLN